MKIALGIIIILLLVLTGIEITKRYREIHFPNMEKCKLIRSFWYDSEPKHIYYVFQCPREENK